MQYLAMTDSQEGRVFILSFDADKGRIEEMKRMNLGETEKVEVVQAATAVWVGNGAAEWSDVGI